MTMLRLLGSNTRYLAEHENFKFKEEDMCRILGYTDLEDYAEFLCGDKPASFEQVEALVATFQRNPDTGAPLTTKHLFTKSLGEKTVKDTYAKETLLPYQCAEGNWDKRAQNRILDTFVRYLRAERVVARCGR